MHVENIKVEDHIVIVGMAGNSPYDNEELYGGPAKVVGICAPYIAIRPVVDPENVRTIDTRFWELTKAPTEYVEAFRGYIKPVTHPASPPEAAKVELSHLCPVCREGRFHRIYEATSPPYWRCCECRSVIVEEAFQS
jgi:hypothetical protein